MILNDKNQYNAQDHQDLYDIRELVFKIYRYWKLLLVSIILFLVLAIFLNDYLPKKYRLNAVISVKEETNPLFYSTTNLTFNWGEMSGLLETMMIILKSRNHNEKVVSNLQFYIDYVKAGKYRLEDVYGKTPFKVDVNENSFQLLDRLIKLETLKNNQFKLSIEFDPEASNTFIRYSDNTVSEKDHSFGKNFTETFYFNQNEFSDSNVKTPFLDINVFSSQSDIKPNQVFYLIFRDINSTVNTYRSLSVESISKKSSLLELEMEGENKNRIVDYLNESIQVLYKDNQEQKTLYARKTVSYVDNLFKKEAEQLGVIRQEIGEYKKANNIFDLSSEANDLLIQSRDLSLELNKVKKNTEELDILDKYVRSNSTYDETVPVPSFIELDDVKLSVIIKELIVESTKLKFLKDKLKPIHPDYQKQVKKIQQIKGNFFENLSNNQTYLDRKTQTLEKELSLFENQLKLLPEKEQKLVKYQKEYDFSEFYFNYFKQKKYEASAAIEATVSDIHVLDKAIDIGQEPIYPKPIYNYSIALLLGIGFPYIYIVIKEFFDNKIRSIDEIENRYNIPILGYIGRDVLKNNLAVFENPNSYIAESYRILRSNIQHLFTKYKTTKRAKTILITSSVGKEGKTIISINLSTVFALGGKKTILLGMDLRRPKIHEYFQLNHDVGLVNYLIHQKTIPEIITKSKIPNLDLILCGSVPKNPSELLMTKACDKLVRHLEQTYDYIIIDTPPVGIISDALELFKYSDAICYIIRQDYSKIGMMDMIDQKYVNNEVSNICYIINDFNFKSKYGYGYGYEYAYGYNENKKQNTLFGKVISL